MKRLITTLLTLGMMGAAAAYMSSCAKQAGPLNPDVNVMGINTTRDANLPRLSSVTAPSSVSATAKIYFNMAMDPASFTGNVKVYTLDDSALTEQEYTQYQISYSPQNRELSLIPNSSAWTNNKYYHVVLNTNIRSSNNKPLDGNGNKIAEGDAFDAVHLYPTIGFPISALPGYVGQDRIGISSINIATNASSSNVWHSGAMGEATPIDASYSNITITVQLSCSQHTQDSNFAMDTTTLVASNFVLTDSTGAVVSCPMSITTTPTGFWHDQIELRPNLVPGGKYYLYLRGGVSGIRSNSAADHRLSRGFYLDGNNNGVAELSDDTRVAIIRVLPNPTVPLVTISSVSFSEGDHRRFTVTFNVPTGSGTLRADTVNTDNFKLMNCGSSSSATSGPTVIPTKVELDNTSILGTPQVYVYVPTKFVASQSNVTQYLRVVVTGNVKSDNNQALDADGDGIPGSDKDYYVSDPSSAVISWWDSTP